MTARYLYRVVVRSGPVQPRIRRYYVTPKGVQSAAARLRERGAVVDVERSLAVSWPSDAPAVPDTAYPPVDPHAPGPNDVPMFDLPGGAG